MSVIINGKPLEEWIEEQKSRDGVIMLHHGVIRTRCSTSHINGAIITDTKKDVCYEDCDLTVRAGGKEYHLQGDKVERIDGHWYVDGKERKDVPVASGDGAIGAMSATVINMPEDGSALREKDIHITINGNVGEVRTDSADVTVTNGNVRCVSTVSGDVNCGKIEGSVSTVSGDVNCGKIEGSVSTMSWDVTSVK